MLLRTFKVGSGSCADGCANSVNIPVAPPSILSQNDLPREALHVTAVHSGSIMDSPEPRRIVETVPVRCSPSFSDRMTVPSEACGPLEEAHVATAGVQGSVLEGAPPARARGGSPGKVTELAAAERHVPQAQAVRTLPRHGQCGLGEDPVVLVQSASSMRVQRMQNTVTPPKPYTPKSRLQGVKSPGSDVAAQYTTMACTPSIQGSGMISPTVPSGALSPRRDSQTSATGKIHAASAQPLGTPLRRAAVSPPRLVHKASPG